MVSTKSGLRLFPVLLEEALPGDAVGHADHRQRPVGEMRQHVRRHLREVAQQVALGQRRLLHRRIGWPVDAVEVRQVDLVRADQKRERVGAVVELGEDLGDPVACLLLCRRGFSPDIRDGRG